MPENEKPSSPPTPKPLTLSAEALDFVPGLLAIQESPPGRLPRVVMYMVVTLCVILILWSIFGKLDIVASAEGRLVPQTYVKIVQPADGGIVQDILVREGEHVVAGQVLMRMDTKDARAGFPGSPTSQAQNPALRQTGSTVWEWAVSLAFHSLARSILIGSMGWNRIGPSP